MKKIEEKLQKSVAKSLKTIYDFTIDSADVSVEKTRKEIEGDFTVVVFPFLRFSKKSPEVTAAEIGELVVEEVEEVVSFNVIKGFLNFEIEGGYWMKFFRSILDNDQFGFSKVKSKSQIAVEYSSPNTNKPLHLGHLRNNFLGYSVAEILKANGHDVIKTQIINDRGIHICKSMLAWQRFGGGETPKSSGLKGDKLVGKYYVKFDQEYKKEIAKLIASGIPEDEAKKEAPIMKAAQVMLKLWEDEDTETRKLWEMMNQWVYDGFEDTYREMGVDIDKLYFESQTYLKGKSVVEEGLRNGVFFQRDDSSIWIDLTKEGLDEKLLLRSDGTAVYMTQDIGTAIQRYDDFASLESQIYTVGNEQEYHFKVLFEILEKLGVKNAKLNYHLSYGMVDLPTGKMKSREGTVVDADDLLSEMKKTAQTITEELGKLDGISEEDKAVLYKQIGYGALKYFLLKVDPKKNMMFDPTKSIDFAGNTGPFIQYGYVRSQAILRKYGKELPKDFSLTMEMNNYEKNIVQKIYEFVDVVELAGKTHSPAILANYSYELIKDFNSFYQNTNVLREENEDLKQFRVALAYKSGQVVKSAMQLLGIVMPERM